MELPAPRDLVSYSRLRRARPAEHLVARDFGDVAALLRRGERERRRVTVRAGGRSFDGQALNEDIVVDVAGLDRVLGVDVARRELTAEAGAPWGALFDAALAHGLTPHIVVTTRKATAGGTLSANCHSRSTPRYGHTGDHVRSFELLTPDGETRTCSRTRNADLFHAVIGGFGYLGVVTQVTYDLLEIGARRRVKTVIERCEGLPAFIERLVERSLDPAPYDAVCSVFSLRSPQRGAVVRSAYTEEPPGRRLQIHQPDAWYRPLAELLFVSSRVGNALCHASYRHVFGRGPFVDDIHGYTFCMEGNEKAKDLADRVGVTLGSMQPSYVVPASSVLFFLGEAARLFAAHDVYPSLLDAVYRPADDFLLSASHRLAGICASFVFEVLSVRQHQRIASCIEQINDACLAAGGRLNLVKDVYATRAQIARMYGHALGELGRLKAKHDPHDVLRNEFFERTFAAGPRAPLSAEPAPADLR